MTDDLTILASAYLDGQATAAERVQVEGDADLVTEVERLRRARSILVSADDAGSAPLSTRERHLAAALDVWDRLPTSDLGGDAASVGSDQAGAAGGASITAPVPLREQRSKRRPVGTRFLTAAAALVVLAGAGVVARGALDNADTNESADTATFDLDSPADSAGDADLSLNELAAEEFAADGEGEAVEAEAVVSGGPEQAPGEGDIEVLSSDAELADYANLLIISRQNRVGSTGASDASDTAADEASSAAEGAPAPTTPPTLVPPVDLCGLIDDFVGFAFWDASGRFDEPVAVGIDNSSREAVAYQADTCTEVARTPLP